MFCPGEVQGLLSRAAAGEGQGLFSCAHDLLAVFLTISGGKGQGGINSASIPPHHRQAVCSGLPYSHPQGQLTHTPATRVSSTVQPGQGAGPDFPSVAKAERWRQLSRVPQPVTGPVLHSTGISMWSPEAAHPRDVTMFSSDNGYRHRHCLLLCSHGLRHGPQQKLRLRPYHDLTRGYSCPSSLQFHLSLHNAQVVPLRFLSHPSTTHMHIVVAPAARWPYGWQGPWETSVHDVLHGSKQCWAVHWRAGLWVAQQNAGFSVFLLLGCVLPGLV